MRGPGPLFVMLGALVACSGSDKPKNDLAKAPPSHATTPPGADDPPAADTPPSTTQEQDDTSAPKTKDAGLDAPPDAALGPDCAKLSACCAEIAAAGEDASTCKSVLSTKNDDACYAQYDRYKQYGDCN